MYTIAVITPIKQSDYLANTVLDGLLVLQKKGTVDFRMTVDYPSPFLLTDKILSDEEFIHYARTADLIIVIWGKKSTNYKMAEKIGMWQKTVFVDGSELGKNNRYDFTIQQKVLNGTYKEHGVIDREMLKKCRLYFRREKPYVDGIVPMPFGIEQRYLSSYRPDIKKDIDFVCIFGQNEYPIMRKYAQEMLQEFCVKNNFSCVTKKTTGFDFDDKTKIAGRNEFYDILARAKVGISIGGGGFDTARFWEILANNCMLLTEKIDIFRSGSDELAYKRISEFSNLYDFQHELSHLGNYLRNEYRQENMVEEYDAIITKHATVSRVSGILAKAKEIGILK